jgi:hypothetical protein
MIVLGIDINTYFFLYIQFWELKRWLNFNQTMGTKFKKGDRVKWKTGKGESTGEITKKITESITIDGKQITATKSKPRYLVKNDNTNSITARAAKSLSLIKDDSNLNSKQQEILENFQEAVNMKASEIKKWLKTKESNSVGQKDQKGKIKGRKSGKKIVKILNKDTSSYSQKDFQHMKKVVGYVHRHLAQKPSGNIQETAWRYSLMNWGCDPLKKNEVRS